MQEGRHCGVFVPLTALPSRFGSGGFGEEALHFIDFLAGNGLSHWQMLSLTYGNHISPYEVLSDKAIHHIFLDPEDLIQEGLLTRSEIVLPENCPEDWVSVRTLTWKRQLLATAYARFKSGKAGHLSAPFRLFIADEPWAPDFGLIIALSQKYQKKPWHLWPEGLASREPGAVAAAEVELHDEIMSALFAQFILRRQWQKIHNYARSKGITLIGDLPFYTAHAGVDAWTNPQLFDLTPAFLTRHSSGAPPDIFGSEGQSWGTPLYNWPALKAEGFRYHIERFGHQLTLFDKIRVDHFHGFVRSWAIPAGKKPTDGHWVKGPGSELLNLIKETVGSERCIIEYIGKDTLRSDLVASRFKAPKVRVMVHELELHRNPEYSVSMDANAVAYTSTHDSPTLLGWYADMPEAVRRRIDTFWRNHKVEALEPLQQRFITPLLKSKAGLVILPLQDILGLGNAHRINVPGTSGSKNWSWRFTWDDIDETSLTALHQALTQSGRVA